MDTEAMANLGAGDVLMAVKIKSEPEEDVFEDCLDDVSI